MLLTTDAYAMAPGAGGGAGSSDFLASFAPLLIIFAIFYFLLIRPQQKRAKEHKAMLDGLRRGDEIVTNGGLVGRVLDMQDDMLTVDLGETKVKMLRSAVTSVPSSAPPLPKGRERKPRKDPKKMKTDVNEGTEAD